MNKWLEKLWAAIEKWIAKQNKPDPIPTPEPPKPDEPTQPDASGVDLSKIKWLGKNYSGAKETTRLNSATISGDKISISYEPYSWPLNSDGGCDAIACFFYRHDNGIQGGKFDWIRKGGQKVKGLENVKGGYGGHEMPARGTDSWLMWVSVDGKERSNMQKVVWK